MVSQRVKNNEVRRDNMIEKLQVIWLLPSYLSLCQLQTWGWTGPENVATFPIRVHESATKDKDF